MKEGMDEMIYVFLASGFEEIEALAVVDILRRAELEVQTVAVGVGEKTVRGAHGIPVVADVTEEQAKPEGLEMVVLPGGMPGTLNLEKSQTVQEFLQLASNNGLWIGAICAAPSILGHNGLADGKRVTCYPGFESQLTQSAYTAAPVEEDGRLITANGPGSAMDFGFLLAEKLTSKERAAMLKGAMQYENSCKK